MANHGCEFAAAEGGAAVTTGGGIVASETGAIGAGAGGAPALDTHVFETCPTIVLVSDASVDAEFAITTRASDFFDTFLDRFRTRHAVRNEASVPTLER